MNRCRRCVIPQSRPDTAFVDGVCSACLAYDKRKAIDWEARGKELRTILDAAKMRQRAYDCIVPSSGGKDSTYQVLTLLELGTRPLVVTASTCHLTPIGRKNIDNLARYATTIEVTPNRSTRAKLNHIGLEEVGDISWPEHASIFTTPFRIAAALDIPLIFYGESPQNQYGGPPCSEEERRMTRRWVSEFGGFLGLRADDLAARQDIDPSDMLDYRLPAEGRIGETQFGPDAYFLGQFLPWDSHRNAQVAIKHGFSFRMPSLANWWEWENLDNAQTGIHDHLCYRKYGFGRLAAQISVDIRAGLIEREEALQVVKENDGHFPYIYAGVTVHEMLDHIGMTMDQLEPILERFTNWALFSGVENRRPILKAE